MVMDFWLGVRRLVRSCISVDLLVLVCLMRVMVAFLGIVRLTSLSIGCSGL